MLTRTLLEIIKSVFDSDAAITNELQNKTYLSLAPDNTALPFCVYSIVSNRNLYQTPKQNVNYIELEETVIRFTVYATSDDFVLQQQENISRLFQNSTFFQDGVSIFSVRQDAGVYLTKEDERTYRSDTTYIFSLTK